MSMTGSMIRAARDQAGISQAELARRVGTPRSVINVYEHGKREPSAEMLARILNATGHRLAAEPVSKPVDVLRASKILEQVLELAEALPYRPAKSNTYPPLVTQLA